MPKPLLLSWSLQWEGEDGENQAVQGTHNDCHDTSTYSMTQNHEKMVHFLIEILLTSSCCGFIFMQDSTDINRSWPLLTLLYPRVNLQRKWIGAPLDAPRCPIYTKQGKPTTSKTAVVATRQWGAGMEGLVLNLVTMGGEEPEAR